MPIAWSLVELLFRNWALVAIVVTVWVLAIVPALVLMKYMRISLNIMRSTKPPLSRNPLDFDRLSGEPVQFTAFDGLRLNGMIVRAHPARRGRGLVVFAHEYCSDMHSCARYCRPLLDVGYDIFTFDFRGHGQSPCDPDYTPRQWLTDREMDDMRGALAFAEQWLEQNGQPQRIALVGVSRGACAAIMAAAENPKVTAIVSDGAFSTDCTIEYFMKRWAYIFASVRVVYENHPPQFWRFMRWLLFLLARREFRCSFPSLRKVIQRMAPRPILFIHGEKDSYLPVEQGRLLYSLAPQPKYFWLAPAARHNQAVALHPETYARLTVSFFDRYHALPDRAAQPEADLAPPAPALPIEDVATVPSGHAPG